MKKLLLICMFLMLALMPFRQAQGQIRVSGNVYEQDSITPIVGASVLFAGVGSDGDTIAYQFLTDSLGYFEERINYGVFSVSACAEGYECAYLPDSLLIDSIPFAYDSLLVVFDSLTGLYDSIYMVYDSLTGVYDTVYPDTLVSGIDFILYENRFPVRYVAARPYYTDLVRISWSHHLPLLYDDFETGDFSRLPWNNSLAFPWVVIDTSAYEGDYCMRSTCGGVGGGLSQIEVPVYIPANGEMSFYCKVSSESNWDVGCFYIDGMKKMEVSGETEWTRYAFAVTEGEHLFRWTYQKDASTDMGDDCFFVDAIRFYEGDEAKAGMPQRSLRYYELFRQRAEETPVLLAYLTDTVFMETGWNSLSWGRYRWGVSCHYEGNRYDTDTVWSVFLDKDMTTTLEVNVTTNVGLSASGAVVKLTAHNGQGNSYQATADANGHALMTNVYRDLYDVTVQLEGYIDYASEEPLSVMEPQQTDIELMEAVSGIDSLYVSFTGFAIWHLSDSLHRDLQYYELRLNGATVGTTTDTTFQFDVSSLSPGDTCLAEVRPVFLSQTCAWQSHEWNYQPCDLFFGSELQWSLGNDVVLLSWDNPVGIPVLGAMLYRGGEYLAFVEGNNYIDATVVMHGEVNYCMRLVYDGPNDGTYYSMSCESCAVATFPVFCDPPLKLEGENYWNSEFDYGAIISWGERPEPVHKWLQYDNGVYKRALGGDNEPIIFWSIRFEAEDLEAYVGTSLKKVSLYDVGAGTYQLWIYVGGETAPRTLVWSQNMTLCNAHDWHEEYLGQTIEIPEDEPLWIVVGQQGLSRPAAACAEQGNPNGRWVSLDGEHWTDMHTYNMHYTWMLRAYVTNRLGRSEELESDLHTLQCYNLYRSYDNNDYQQVAAIPVVEGQAFYQYRDVLVDESHNAFYYKLTALYLSEDGETCESDFAASLYHPEENFVYVDDHWATEEREEAALKLYPNPSNGQITIEQEGMQKVMVYNALGQLLLDKETSSDALQLDLSRFGKGLYWIKVTAQDGAAEKPFVLARKLIIH